MSMPNNTSPVGGGPPDASGGSPSGCTVGLPPPHILATLPKRMQVMLTVDYNFTPNLLVEGIIFIFLSLYYIPSLLFYIKYREHLLIRYRQPISVISGAIICSVNALLIPAIRYFSIPCLINTWLVNTLVLTLYIVTFSRYVRTFFMQRLSMFKLKFSEKKNSHMANTKIEAKSDRLSMRTSELNSKEIEEASMKQTPSSINRNSSAFSYISNGIDSLNMIDPITYFKNLNLIINKYITIYLVIIPLIILLIYSIIITITKWCNMKTYCVNELKEVSYPKLIMNIIIIATSIYFFYQAYFKQKWDPELKYEYTIFVVVVIICTIVMQLTVFNKLNETMVRYRVYIFQFLAISIHAVCIYEPLIRIFFDKFKEKDNKLTEEEFLMKFSNTHFKAQVKEIATNTFCIENVLFFDAHVDLMNMIISYYSKRNTITSSEANGYSSSDILHKNTISPALYKPFDNAFKPKFEQIYNLYIKEDGIASINIKSTTIKNIEEQMENNNYSYLMFHQAAEEVGELLYNNIFPRMKF